MLSEEVALHSIDQDRLKAMSLEELEQTFARAAKENADYLRQCAESGDLPNGVIAGLSCALARAAEGEILERKLKNPGWRQQEMQKVKGELTREKAEKGRIGYPTFRQFMLLQELAKEDRAWVAQMGLDEFLIENMEEDPEELGQDSD